MPLLLWQNPTCGTKGIGVSQHRESRHFLRASIDQCTKFRFRSICYPGLTCWGVPSPSPAINALTGEKMKGVIPYHDTKNLPHTKKALRDKNTADRSRAS